MTEPYFDLLGLQVKAIPCPPVEQVERVRVELESTGLFIYWNYPPGSKLVEQLDDSIGVEPWLLNFYPLFRFDPKTHLLKFIFISERVQTVKSITIGMRKKCRIHSLHLQQLQYAPVNWSHVLIDVGRQLCVIGQATADNDENMLLELGNSFALISNPQQQIIGVLLDLKAYFGVNLGVEDIQFLQKFMSVISLDCWEQQQDEESCRQLQDLMREYKGTVFRPYFDAIHDDIRFLL